MRRRIGVITIGLFLASIFGWSAAVSGDDGDKLQACGNNGTAVHFEGSPSVAARKAKTEHKLVFVLHVSGLFEDPCKT